MRQTMSVLAGHSGTDRWVMTAALRRIVIGGGHAVQVACFML